MTKNQKIQLIEKWKSLKELPNSKKPRRAIREQLFQSLTGTPEDLGNYVLVKSGGSKPYLQIFSKNGYLKSQEYIRKRFSNATKSI